MNIVLIRQSSCADMEETSVYCVDGIMHFSRQDIFGNSCFEGGLSKFFNIESCDGSCIKEKDFSEAEKEEIQKLLEKFKK